MHPNTAYGEEWHLTLPLRGGGRHANYHDGGRWEHFVHGRLAHVQVVVEELPASHAGGVGPPSVYHLRPPPAYLPALCGHSRWGPARAALAPENAWHSCPGHRYESHLHGQGQAAVGQRRGDPRKKASTPVLISLSISAVRLLASTMSLYSSSSSMGPTTAEGPRRPPREAREAQERARINSKL